MKNLIARFIREEEGQDVIEYGLLGAFISVVAAITIVAIGVDVQTMFTTINDAIVP
jgi:pilus assembly protein Flp/PilA